MAWTWGTKLLLVCLWSHQSSNIDTRIGLFFYVNASVLQVFLKTGFILFHTYDRVGYVHICTYVGIAQTVFQRMTLSDLGVEGLLRFLACISFYFLVQCKNRSQCRYTAAVHTYVGIYTHMCALITKTSKVRWVAIAFFSLLFKNEGSQRVSTYFLHETQNDNFEFFSQSCT